MNEEEKSKVRELGKMAKEAINIGEQRSGNPLEGLMGAVYRLDQFAQYMDGTMRMLASTIDIGQLTDKLIVKILIEKGLITEEEFNDKFKEEVIETYKKMEEKMREEVKKKLEEQIEQEKQEEEKVVEMAKNVVPFTDKKDVKND